MPKVENAWTRNVDDNRAAKDIKDDWNAITKEIEPFTNTGWSLDPDTTVNN
jgi:hypothetical protein